MSGGLHPWPKYEQVVADDCWPMKLEVVMGVAAATVPEPELLPLTPPVLPTRLAGPLPFGQSAASLFSSVEAEAACLVVPVGETT